VNRTGQLGTGRTVRLFRRAAECIGLGEMIRSSRVAPVLLAFLLLFSSVRCMRACAAEPCSDNSQSSVPPCHRHHVPAGQVPHACLHVLTMDAKHSAASLAVPNFTAGEFAPPIAALFLPHRIAPAATSFTPSPPNLKLLSPVILRI